MQQQLIESPLKTGVVYCDDNLARLTAMPDECVDLIYLDPPFFSNRNYEVIWGDESEIRSFEDRWKGGLTYYVEWMRRRLVEMYRVLKPTGSLYLHCDPAASHYLKVAMDTIFGPANFRNEIIWKRTGAHSGAKCFGPVHDTILFYSRSDDFYWQEQRGAYDPRYVRSKFTMADADGRLFQPISLTPPGTRNGETGQPWRGIDPTARGYHWKYQPSKLDELDDQDLIYWPAKKNGMPRLKFYLDEAPGMVLQDVWTDIPPVNARASERLGYPTQKPEALMERIIAASSKHGDIVLDPFCGCGTTVSVAEKMQRRWIGIDVSLTAADIIARRLEKIGAVVEVDGLPKSTADLRRLKPLEFQNWVIKRVYGKHSPRATGDFGIDGYSFLEDLPIQVKQSDRVGRNVVDNFETAIRRAGKHKGYIIAFSFGRGAYEEAARVLADGLEIALVEVRDLLDLRDVAPRAATDQMLSDLLHAAKLSAADPVLKGPRPRRTVEELVASDLT